MYCAALQAFGTVVQNYATRKAVYKCGEEKTMRNEIMLGLIADFNATKRVHDMYLDYRKQKNIVDISDKEGYISFTQWYKRERQRIIAAQENIEGVA